MKWVTQRARWCRFTLETVWTQGQGKPEAGQDWKFPQLGPRSARRSEADLSLTRASEANAFVIGLPARSFALATIALFKIASRRARIS
jgi:hypothetical protein